MHFLQTFRSVLSMFNKRAGGFYRGIKPRSNGRNIVGQQLPTLLDVTCCVRLHTLLHVVGCCCAKFETGQTFQPTTPNIFFVPWSPKRSATMLDPFSQLLQHCWGHARSLRMNYKDLWVVFFPRYTAGTKLVGSCCIRSHTTANTQATTPNIVGATTLGVVAPVCKQPKATRRSRVALYPDKTRPVNLLNDF